MDYVIGVDIGTTNTKAIATDLGGRVQFRFEAANTTITPKPGHYEQDPEALYETTKTCIARVVAGLKDHDPFLKILAVSFSSAMHGVIALDYVGNPLINCILWSDIRSASAAEKLKETELGKQFYSHTGTPIHAMSPLCKIAWMKDHMPEVYHQTAKFISVKEYIFFRLFNEFVVDHSIAAATGFFDINHRSWYIPALEYMAIDASQLSRPVPITHSCRGLRAPDAEAMGLAEDTPFVIGGSDGCLANLGVGATRPGVAAVTVGTSGAIRVAERAPRVDSGGRVFSYMLTPDLHIIGGAVNNGGNVLQWFLENLCTESRDGTLDHAVESLLARVASVPPGTDGLVFLPYLLGERAPLWDASVTGAYFGIRMHHDNAHFARATIEGVIFGLFDVGRVLMEHTGPITTIHATGGFFDSDFCVQLLADVFNTPVHVKEDGDGSALGAVVVARYALGHLPSLHQVEEPRDIHIVYPDKSRHDRYMQAFERYARFVELLKDKF